jgi:ribosomal-protein-alanine N-acetyltransferase
MSRVVLETARLHLRPVDAGDVDALHRHWTDADVRRFLWDDVVIERGVAEDVVRSSEESFAAHGFGFWAVRPREAAAGEPIGCVGLRHFGDPPEVEVLYSIEPRWWGRGVATEATRAVLRFAFEALGLPLIHAGADVPNAASFEVMRRCGFRFDRRRRINGLDADYWVLAREQWRPGDGA